MTVEELSLALEALAAKHGKDLTVRMPDGLPIVAIIFVAGPPAAIYVTDSPVVASLLKEVEPA